MSKRFLSFPQITWDGHTSSVEAATRAARANITIEDQIHQIHKVKGLLPDEEKEKIGPKPVMIEASPHLIPKAPITTSAAPQIVKPPAPVSAVQLQPMPPQPPTILPTPNQPVMLIPSAAVPQMPARPPLMG